MRRHSTFSFLPSGRFISLAGWSITVGSLLLTAPAFAQSNYGSSQNAGANRPKVSFVAPPPSRGPLIDFGDNLADLIDQVQATVVHIRSFRADDAGNITHEETGSGVLMADLRPGAVVVVTNRHVVAGAALSNIQINLSDGRELRPIEKADDEATDLAVLRLRETGLPRAQWGDSQGLRIGHFVIACGSPFGLSESVTLGIVSATGRRALDLNDQGSVINQDFIQTDAAINPGNSGGPLIGMEGRVVGINTAIASKSGGNDGIGFSIPAALAQYITTQLLRDGEIHRGFLGVTLNDSFDTETAKELRLRRAIGAHITGVHPNSPAARAGISENDVVIQFRNAAVEDERHLIHLVSLTPPRQKVPVVVIRNGAKVVLNVTLEERTRVSVEQGTDVPRLGAVPSDVRGISDSAAMKRPRLQQHQGRLLVTRAVAPLRLYDLVLKVDGVDVASLSDFNNAFGDGAIIEIERGGERQLVVWSSPKPVRRPVILKTAAEVGSTATNRVR